MAINFQNVNISLSQFHEVARHGGLTNDVFVRRRGGGK